MDALIISAEYKEQEMAAIREKFRPDVISFVMALVRFGNRYRLSTGSGNTVQDALEIRREYDHTVTVPARPTGIRASTAGRPAT